MHATALLRPFCLVLLLCGLPPAAAASDQDMRELVEQVLDSNIRNVRIENLPLHEALARLEKETGLRFVVSPAIERQMPFGARTQITIEMQDLPLRIALMRVLDGLGLTMQVRDSRVFIEPAPLLFRMGRKLTVEELALLGKLAQRSWSELRGELTVRFDLDAAQDAAAALDRALEKPRAATALHQLDEATQQLGWTWAVDGAAIVIQSRAAFLQRALDHPLDVSYRRLPLDQLLADLGARMGVTVLFEPGVLSRIGASGKQVDLIQNNTTARQVLERICGSTGLAYEITAGGLRIFAPADGSTPPTATAPSRRVVAQISIPQPDGTLLTLPVYEGELPAEQLAALREMHLANIRRMLAESNLPKPPPAP